MSRARLTDSVLPAALNKDGWEFVKCDFDPETTTFKAGSRDQFQSNLLFLTATVKKDGKEKRLPLVVKLEPFMEALRARLNTNTQFCNEVLMYGEVLPVLDDRGLVEDIFPRYYHGVAAPGDSTRSVVVLQDLRPLGFKMTDKSDTVSYEHFKVAMAKLGQFHAMSYSAKKSRPDKFYKSVQNLKETSWGEKSVLESIARASFHRAMDPLVRAGKHLEVLQKLLDRVDDNVPKLLFELVRPEEPMAVVNHGDFCRNNVLFKYDDGGEPVDVKFFDIATSRYASPMVDISFFLFLNSTPQMRKDHLGDWLETYHHALTTTIPGTTVPSLEDIRQEFKRKAMYGFVHCSFFLPTMVFGFPFDSMEDFVKLESEDQVRAIIGIGGDAGTRLLTDLVEELIHTGCLTTQHAFLSS